MIYSISLLACILGISMQLCINNIRNTSLTRIVAHRLFPNNSLMILDREGKINLMDWEGNLTYSEEISLPLKSDGLKNRIFCASIGASGEVYARLDLEESFKYSNGSTTNNYTDSGSFKFPMQAALFVPHPDVCVSQDHNLTEVFHFTGGAFQSVSNFSSNSENNLNRYLHRVSVNLFTNELFYVSKSNQILATSLKYNATSLTYEFEPNNSSTPVYLNASIYLITSSIGGNGNFFCFYGFVKGNTSGILEQHLFIVNRSSSAAVLVEEFNDFIVSSVLLSNSSDRVYILSNDGELYSLDFVRLNNTNGTVATTGALQLISSGIHTRMAHMNWISNDLIAVTSHETFATFNLTSGKSLIINMRPSSLVNLPSNPLSALMYPNIGFVGYYTTTHSEQSTWMFEGDVKRLVSPASTNLKEVYALTSSELITFHSISLTVVARKNLTELQTELAMLTNGTVSSLVYLSDIEPMEASHGQVALLSYVRLNDSTSGSMMVVMNSTTLELTQSFWLGFSEAHMQSVSVMLDPTNSSQDAVVVVGPNCAGFYTYNQGNLSHVENFTNIEFNYTDHLRYSNDTEMQKVRNVNGIFSEKQKNSVLGDHAMIFVSGRSSYVDLCFRNCPGSNSSASFSAWGIVYPAQNIQSSPRPAIGLYNSKTFRMSSTGYLNLSKPQNGMDAEIYSDNFRQGVMYQIAPSQTIYFSGGSSFLSSMSHLDCYTGNEVSLLVKTNCTLSNCSSCSPFVDRLCRHCSPGLYLDFSSGSCVDTCGSQFYAGMNCVSDCSVFSFKYTGATNYCLSKQECNTNFSRFTFANWCLESCPAGSTAQPSGDCKCDDPNTLPMSPSFACSSSGAPGYLYWGHGEMYGSESYFWTFIKTSTTAYCIADYHYYEVSTKKCIGWCNQLVGMDDTYGRFCATAKDCTDKGWITDPNAPGLCLENCPFPVVWMHNKTCYSNCSALPFAKYAEPSNFTCMEMCPDKISDPYNNCLRKVELLLENCSIGVNQDLKIILKFVYSGPNWGKLINVSLDNEFQIDSVQSAITNQPILGYSLNHTINASEVYLSLSSPGGSNYTWPNEITISPNESIAGTSNGAPSSFLISTLTCRPYPPKPTGLLPPSSESSKFPFGLYVTTLYFKGTVRTIKSMIPLIYMVMDTRGASILCLVSLTYTKLVFIRYFNFELVANDVSEAYYNIFREILDEYNEKLLTLVIGPELVEENKKVVCDTGFNKMCRLTVEDNFFLANMITILVFAAQLAVCFALKGAAKLLKARIWQAVLQDRLKTLFIAAFFIDNNLEFMFSMLLNCRIILYRGILLATTKILGYGVLAVVLGGTIWFVLSSTSKQAPTIFESPDSEEKERFKDSSIKTLKVRLQEMVTKVMGDIWKKSLVLTVAKAIFIYNFVFACLIVFLNSFPLLQLSLLAFMESAVAFVFFKYRLISIWQVNLIQKVISSLFLGVTIVLLFVKFLEKNNEAGSALNIVLLSISLAILFIDFLLIVGLVASKIWGLIISKPRRNKVMSLNRSGSNLKQEGKGGIKVPFTVEAKQVSKKPVSKMTTRGILRVDSNDSVQPRRRNVLMKNIHRRISSKPKYTPRDSSFLPVISSRRLSQLEISRICEPKVKRNPSRKLTEGSTDSMDVSPKNIKYPYAI